MSSIFKISHDMIAFTNIEEIKFTKVNDEGVYKITIKSDVEPCDKSIETRLPNATFEASYCKLDSELRLTFTEPSMSICGIESKYYEIPINIKLLLNDELNNIFTITKGQNNDQINSNSN